MIKKQTMLLITSLLIILVIFVNIEKSEKKTITYAGNETVKEEMKKDFKIDKLGSIIYPDHPAIGWLIVVLILICIGLGYNKLKQKVIKKKR